ncbi:hypothetical protein JCM8097_002862 [Rhodosporidiobolus ruineniae]
MHDLLIPTQPARASTEVIDLTNASRSPPPLKVKVEEDDSVDHLLQPHPPSSKRPVSPSFLANDSADRFHPRQRRTAPFSSFSSSSSAEADLKPSLPPHPDAEPEARAHLRLDNLPTSLTAPAQLEAFLAPLHLDGLRGVLLERGTDGEPWALVTFSSLACSGEAYEALEGRRITCFGSDEGRKEEEEAKTIRVKLYSAAGDALPPSPALPLPLGARRPPLPRLPSLFTAAELRRRLYVGSLPFGVSEAEVDGLFRDERVAVRARVVRVMRAVDGSHAWAFVQLPDKTTADHALSKLHGAIYQGHYLRVEHVNELGHEWRFSITLSNLPYEWTHLDVSDLLVLKLGSFAGLWTGHDPKQGKLKVRIEMRYATETKWATEVLDNLPLSFPTAYNGPPTRVRLRATIDQPALRRVYEEEHGPAVMAEEGEGEGEARMEMSPGPSPTPAPLPFNLPHLQPSGQPSGTPRPVALLSPLSPFSPLGAGGGATPPLGETARRAPPLPPSMSVPRLPALRAEGRALSPGGGSRRGK